MQSNCGTRLMCVKGAFTVEAHIPHCKYKQLCIATVAVRVDLTVLQWSYNTWQQLKAPGAFPAPRSLFKRSPTASNAAALGDSAHGSTTGSVNASSRIAGSIVLALTGVVSWLRQLFSSTSSSSSSSSASADKSTAAAEQQSSSAAAAAAISTAADPAASDTATTATATEATATEEAAVVEPTATTASTTAAADVEGDGVDLAATVAVPAAVSPVAVTAALSPAAVPPVVPLAAARKGSFSSSNGSGHSGNSGNGGSSHSRTSSGSDPMARYRPYARDAVKFGSNNNLSALAGDQKLGSNNNLAALAADQKEEDSKSRSPAQVRAAESAPTAASTTK
jgi:hypothetical protein